jgi:mannose-6-phosphate isomerase-like protein (cupin superfamily)
MINKPWGHEELIEYNEHYTMKKLFMKKNHSCSLQYHNQKHETVYVLSGQLLFEVGDTKETLTHLILTSGMSYVIPPKTVHRMSGIEDTYYLEASTSQLDDVVRLEDKYGRI